MEPRIRECLRANQLPPFSMVFMPFRSFNLELGCASWQMNSVDDHREP